MSLTIPIFHGSALFDPVVHPMDPARLTGFSIRKRSEGPEPGEEAVD